MTRYRAVRFGVDTFPAGLALPRRRQLQAREYWMSDVRVGAIDDGAAIRGCPRRLHYRSDYGKLCAELGGENGQ